MQIQGVGNNQAWQSLKPKQGESKSEADKATNGPGQWMAKTTSPAVEASHGQPEEKGVIRLLESGHFKGVAEVRLQINFHEELQQIAHREAGELMASKGPALVDALDDEVQRLGINEEFIGQVSDLMDTFEEAVSSAVTGTKDGQFEVTAALETIDQAFGALFEGLKQFTPASEGVPLVDETESVAAAEAASGGREPMVTTTSDPPEAGNADAVSANPFNLALDRLQKWFDLEMTSLAKLVTNSSALPTLTEAPGNGQAYARFLETYKALQNTTGATNGGPIESAPIEGVQAVA